MDFIEKTKQFSERIKGLKDQLSTEEATKTSIIMPFFQLLGYDVFNPLEFIPEYTADVGIKKGEKVDYAIFLKNTLNILIEAKSINERLEKHDSQLFRYFGTTSAKFAILTNGVEYRFYTDLDEPNKMDSAPFFSLNLLDFTDQDINELSKFSKENFDVSQILDTASELKDLSLIKTVLREEFSSPSDDFVKLIISKEVYSGRFSQAVIDKYRPIVKKSISQYVNDLVNDKIQNALKTDDKTIESEVVDELPEEEPKDSIITTEEELQAFYIVKSLLIGVVDLDRITYKDTLNYFGIILDGKVTRWICRMVLKESTKYLIISENNQNVKYTIGSVEDVYKLADRLKARALTL